jgi:DNA ligase-1
LPFSERRRRLEEVLDPIDHDHLRVTDLVEGGSWEAWEEIRETSRDRHSEGLMLKRKDASYDVGRVRGTWWKWKVAPLTIDAVLIYAQKGHGKRASLFTDYTFALWDDEKLVPFAKAYSGLSDAEIRKVDRFIRQNTKEKFGPVRSVTPTLVMELAFEGLQRSKRHKSGIATRFPRILRWRHDKKPEDANTLNELLQLLPE